MWCIFVYCNLIIWYIINILVIAMVQSLKCKSYGYLVLLLPMLFMAYIIAFI